MYTRTNSIFQEAVDPAPTAADFPRRMWREKDIDPDYSKYLWDWLKAGISLEHIIFVPKKPHQDESREYMTAFFKKELMLLTREKNGTITDLCIKKETICCFCSTEDLLRGCITVYWDNRYEKVKTELPYNRVMRQLFLPLLNWLADCPEDFDCKEAVKYDEPPRQLKWEQPSLFHYAEEAYRFGCHGFHWDWYSFVPPGRLKKRAVKTFCLLVSMECGQVLILLSGSCADIWYLKEGKSKASLKDKGKLWKLFIEAGQDEILTLSFKKQKLL